MADDEMLCESLGEQIHRARKEGAKSERERILKIIKESMPDEIAHPEPWYEAMIKRIKRAEIEKG